MLCALLPFAQNVSALKPRRSRVELATQAPPEYAPAAPVTTTFSAAVPSVNSVLLSAAGSGTLVEPPNGTKPTPVSSAPLV